MGETGNKTTRTAADRVISIECLRYDPETDSEPRRQTYQVPFTDDMSVLQGLQYIKDHLDGSLTFRWSCRMAICGSCGMMVNGLPALSCQTFLRDYYPGVVRIDPLNHFPIMRDLVIDQTDFLRKLESVKPYLIPGEPRSVADGTYLQTPAQTGRVLPVLPVHQLPALLRRLPAVRAELLVHRAGRRWRCCTATTPIRGMAEPRERMPIINAEDGVWGCTLVGYCSEVCPKGVDPARAINQNKINSTKDYFLRFLAPWGKAGGNGP